MEGAPILKRLYDLGAATLARCAGDALANPLLAGPLTWAVRTALEARGRMDRHMQTVLGVLNIPSRADLGRLVTKLEAIQGSLVNLNLKVDRLLAGRPTRRRGRKPAKPPGGA
jgi:hypothetical protein